MHPAIKSIVLPGALAFAVSVPIAINHDEAVLDGERSVARTLGAVMREHLLGSLAAAGLTGAALSAYALSAPARGHTLLAAAVGVAGGIGAGHVAFDMYLQSR